MRLCTTQDINPEAKSTGPTGLGPFPFHQHTSHFGNLALELKPRRRRAGSTYGTPHHAGRTIVSPILHSTRPTTRTATRETSARKCQRFGCLFHFLPSRAVQCLPSTGHRAVRKGSPASQPLPLPSPQPLIWPALVGCIDRTERQIPGHLTSPDVRAAAACKWQEFAPARRPSFHGLLRSLLYFPLFIPLSLSD